MYFVSCQKHALLKKGSPPSGLSCFTRRPRLLFPARRTRGTTPTTPTTWDREQAVATSACTHVCCVSLADCCCTAVQIGVDHCCFACEQEKMDLACHSVGSQQCCKTSHQLLTSAPCQSPYLSMRVRRGVWVNAGGQAPML